MNLEGLAGFLGTDQATILRACAARQFPLPAGWPVSQNLQWSQGQIMMWLESPDGFPWDKPKHETRYQKMKRECRLRMAAGKCVFNTAEWKP